MSSPLRVLIVEDSLSDALSLLRELGDGGYNLVHERVDARDALVSALDGQTWDIVIAGYTVPELNALNALELLKEKGLKLPFFIVMADPINEDIAVSAMQAGVEEIIMKGNLARLVPAVERVLGDRVDRREQRPTEGALEETTGHLVSLIESSSDAIISTNKEGELAIFNRGAEALLGYQRNEVIGSPVSVLFESEERVEEMMRQMKERGGTVSAFETALRAKDGNAVPVMLSASTLYDEDGQEAGFVGFSKDLQERERAEEATKRFARQKAAVAQFMSLAQKKVEVKDLMDAAVHLTAEALGVEFCEILKLENSGESLRMVSGVGWPQELVGSATVGSGADSLAGYTLEEASPVVVEDLQSESRFAEPSLLKDHGVVSGLSVPMTAGELVFGVMGAHTAKRRDFYDEDVRFLEAVASLLTAAVLRKQASEALQRANEEISRQVKGVEKAQVQLIRAEKEAAVERLTAGVSHEILNPLNVISLRLQMMSKDPALPPDMTRHLQALEGQANRIAKNIRDLLYYARQSPPEYRQVDLNETVTRTLDLLEGDLGKENITLELRLTEGLPPILADVEQLQQVILRLLNNARETMPDGGRLVLSTGAVQSNGQSFVEFKVKDTGEGIAPDDLDKLFDPSVTTEPEGEGTGLGLYVCQGIIEAHGGTIKAESEKGQGATFTFQLPMGQDKESKG